MLPGMSQVREADLDSGAITRVIAIVDSMTPRERSNPRVLNGSRKKRIAAGAGMEVSDLNKLLKMHRQMADMMKKMGKMGKGGMLKQAMRGMFGKGGMPPGMPADMDPKALEAAAKQMGGNLWEDVPSVEDATNGSEKIASVLHGNDTSLRGIF